MSGPELAEDKPRTRASGSLPRDPATYRSARRNAARREKHLSLWRHAGYNFITRRVRRRITVVDPQTNLRKTELRDVVRVQVVHATLRLGRTS